MIADAAGSPAARMLIQPDADILLSVDRRHLSDPALFTRVQDEQSAITARLALASWPVHAMSTVTHTAFAVAYLSIAREAVTTFEYWLAQALAASGAVLLGMLIASGFRRVALRWLLRRL